MKGKTVGIIGGGAAGMMAAIAVLRRGGKAVIFEKKDRPGKKILATGNGRCNMTNINAAVKNYHGSQPRFVNGAMHRFWVRETLDLFGELGVIARIEEDGKVYPYSLQASSVLDALRLELERLGCRVNTDREVCRVRAEKHGFRLYFTNGENFFCDRLIIAAGGKASPVHGSDGSGFRLAQGLGHSITPLSPVLVQLKTSNPCVRGLKGIKVQGTVSCGKNVSAGEILFTDYGLSGVPVFWISSYAGEGDTVCLDIMPEYSEGSLCSILRSRRESLSYRRAEQFFTGMLQKQVGFALMKAAGISPLSRAVSTFSDRELERLASLLKRWEFPVTGNAGWNNAQVTRGGVRTREVDPATMQSLIMPGLFFAGEILDIDGDCGGYNLQWAWSSGYIAGSNAAE